MPQLLQQKDLDRSNPSFVFSVYPSNKGLVTSRVATNIPAENSIEDTNNFMGFSGTRRTRPGIEPFSPVPLSAANESGIQFLMEHWRLDTSSQAKQLKNLAVSKDTIWADDGVGNFRTIGEPSPTEGKAISGDVLVGLAVIGIEDLGLFTYDHSTSVTQLFGEPNLWIVKKHRNSIYAAGNKSAPDVLYKSNFETVNFTGGTAEAFNLDTGAQDSSGITALFEYFGRLYAAKESSIYEIQTEVLGAPVRILSKTIGCIAHNGVQEIGGDVIFPSIRGLHSLSTTNKYGDITQTFLSEPVADLWENSIDLARSQLISSAFIPEYTSYLMLYPVKNSSSFNLLGYNIATGDFFLWPDYPATFISRHIDKEERIYRMLVGDSKGRVGRGRKLLSEVYLDFDKGYTTSFTTPPIFPQGSLAEQFQFKALKLFIKPRTGVITINYQIDNGATTSISIDQSEFTSIGSLATKTVPITGIGTTINLSFSCPPDGLANGAAMEILGYNIECVSVGDSFQTIEFKV